MTILKTIIAGASALILLFTIMPMSVASTARTSFAPAFSTGGLGEGATFTGTFEFSGTEYGGFPAPLTKLFVHLPAGVGGSSAGFAVCSQPILESHEILKCPPGSSAGPVGSVGMVIAFGATRVVEIGTLQAIFGPGEDIYFFVEGTSPASIEILMKATYTADAAPYGRVLDLEIPLIETVPGAPYTSITGLTLNMGTSREEGGSELYSVTIPDACPSGTFNWAADANFFGEPMGEHVTAETACPGASKRAATTTAIESDNPSPLINEDTTFTATVKPTKPGGGNLPSGSVTFLDSGAPMSGCSGVSVTKGASSSTATCTVGLPAAGPQAITAAYNGDANFMRSTSAPLGVNVREPLAGGGSTGGGSTTRGSTSGGIATQGSTGGGGPAIAGSEQIAALLVSQLKPSGKATAIIRLLKRGSFSLAFTALTAGMGEIAWYVEPRRARPNRKTKAKSILVASGQLGFATAQTGRIKLELTAFGKRLLTHPKRLELTAKATFTPAGQAPVSVSKTFAIVL